MPLPNPPLTVVEDTEIQTAWGNRVVNWLAATFGRKMTAAGQMPYAQSGTVIGVLNPPATKKILGYDPDNSRPRWYSIGTERTELGSTTNALNTSYSEVSLSDDWRNYDELEFLIYSTYGADSQFYKIIMTEAVSVPLLKSLVGSVSPQVPRWRTLLAISDPDKSEWSALILGRELWDKFVANTANHSVER